MYAWMPLFRGWNARQADEKQHVKSAHRMRNVHRMHRTVLSTKHASNEHMACLCKNKLVTGNPSIEHIKQYDSLI